MCGDEICTITKKLKDDPIYLEQLQQCAVGAPLQDISLKALVYPNPGRGTYNCMLNGQPVIADEIEFTSNGLHSKAASEATSGMDVTLEVMTGTPHCMARADTRRARPGRRRIRWRRRPQDPGR